MLELVAEVIFFVRFFVILQSMLARAINSDAEAKRKPARAGFLLADSSGLIEGTHIYAKKNLPVFLGDYADFDRFVETLTAIKQK